MLTEIRERVRKGLRAVAPVPALLLLLTLPVCADKEAAIDPSHRAELAQALENAEHETSERLLSEARLKSARGLAVLSGGAAPVLSLAVGSSRRKSEGD